MTPSELYDELRKQGHYVLVSVSTDDAIEYFNDSGLEPTPDEIIEALEYIYRKWPCGEDYQAACEWISERIKEQRDTSGGKPHESD